MSKPQKYRHGTPREFACPYCKHFFPIDEILFRESGTSALVKGQRSLLKRLRGEPPQPPNRNGSPWDLVCPGPACNQKLPYTAATEQSLVIGLVGAQASGKSHYMTSLIHRLGEETGKRFKVGLLPADDETRQRFATQYHQRLFRDHLRLQFDKGKQEKLPLLYNLNFSGSLWGEAEPRSVTLALYDTAGENLESVEDIEQFCSYLGISSGIIFVVDPLQSPGIRQRLDTQANLPPVHLKNTPQNMISRVIELMHKKQLVRKGKRFRTPIAFTMTKCDVLLNESVIDKKSRWASKECHEGFFNTDLHEDLATSMEELFAKYEPQTHNNIDNNFESYGYFGVSATGCEPDPKTDRYPTLAPLRVEEPLLWLLAKVGVIPERHDKSGL